jgi:hypothetical protein
MFAPLAPEKVVQLTLYTDSYVVRGTIRTRQHRITDILNRSDEPFLVVEEAVIEEYGVRGETIRADFAQVNLGAVLFAVSDVPVEPVPELRTPKVQEQALITVPPFKVTATIHLLPERELRNALQELTGRFIPATDATYWSDVIGEARATVGMLAFNHDRAQILAPHRIVDPWAGLDRPGQATTDAASPAADRPAGDPSAGW